MLYCFIIVCVYIVYIYIIYIYIYIWPNLIKIGVRAGARAGYVIPGRDGIGGLDLARNSSAVVVVAIVAPQPWTDRDATPKIKRCYFGVQNGPAGHWTGDTLLKK